MTEVATATLTPPPSSAAAASSSPRLAPGTPFGSRYSIIKVLGSGGMGVVYQAWDQELDAPVALKVIRPEITADPIAGREVEQRFKRELLLARQVTHHNVVRIHDIGQVEGVKYISMPLIDGQDLAGMLAHGQRISLALALDLTRQIAEGLRAAHAAGVVHRDLKPENVMVDRDGRAVIMDFGISRSTTAAMATRTATAIGAIVGTLEYMAPEQARGEHVDHRADIYALGLILHDMLAGRGRFAAGAVAEMMERLETPERALADIGAEVPDSVRRIITRCVSTDPARRYQTAAELLSDLDLLGPDGQPVPRARVLPLRVALAGAALVSLLLAAVIGFEVLRWRSVPAAPVAREPLSVLIADFENRAKEPLFDGVLEQALAIAMEGAPFITTYPRAGAIATAAQLGRNGPGDRLDERTARLVAQREGLNVVLAGSIAGTGGGFSINVRAIDAVPGTELASATARAGAKPDVLRAVASAASKLREALGDVTLESERLAAAETYTSASLEAASAYATGQQHMTHGRWREAIREYARATDLDPEFGRAWAAWAVAAFTLGQKDEAERLYQKAFGLLDRMTDREKFRTYGAYHLSVAENYPKAVEYYTQLVTKYPSDRGGHSNLAMAYFYTLNFPKALEHGRRAVEIYRGNPKFRSNYALYAMYAGDFVTATKAAGELVTEVPTYYRAYLPIAMAAIAVGDIAAARAAYDRMEGAGPEGRSTAATGRADLAMYLGDFDAAIRILSAGIDEDARAKNAAARGAKHVALAEALAGSSDHTRAVVAATQAVEGLNTPSVLLPAGRVLARAKRTADARALAAKLSKHVQPEHRAYAKLIGAEIALAEGRASDAAALALDAQRLADLWPTRLALGIAYVEAGAFGAAVPELEACLTRRGEASAVFLDDVPSIRYLAPVHYWLARAQEGMGLTANAAVTFKRFLALRPEPSRDPLAADARRRLDP